MNQQIRELALQSGYGTRWTSTEQFEQFMEKFAELIVRECAAYVEYQLQVGAHNAERLKQHFGVEE